MTVRDRRHRSAGEQAAAAPGDEAFSGEQCSRSREEEGAAALCGDGETHQVGDRPRTDCGSPELPHVRMLCREPGRALGPHPGFNRDPSGGGWARGPYRSNGDARRWRENPGTGGRTSTVSGNGSGRRRGCERHTQYISNSINERQEPWIRSRNVSLSLRRPTRSAPPTTSGRSRDDRRALRGFPTPQSSRR